MTVDDSIDVSSLCDSTVQEGAEVEFMVDSGCVGSMTYMSPDLRNE